MASEPEASAFERIHRLGSLSSFLPLILGVTSSSTTTNTDAENPDQESPETTSQHERIILINPLTQGMVVIEGTASLDSLIRDLATKYGHPPASKASIEALAGVDVEELGDYDSECAICLEEWANGDGEGEVVVVKEMPCKHKFHGSCIEKWLRIHGSCPVCRFKMPVGDEQIGKKRDQEEAEEEEEEERGGRSRRRAREIWVSFSFNRSRRNDDSNQSPPTNPDDTSTMSTPNPDQQIQD